MSGDSEKDCTQCLVCCSEVGVSTQNSICIFKDGDVTTITASDKPLVDVIAAVLETDINEDSVHSRVICNHCFTLFNEVDELEARLTEIKMELSHNYNQTMKQLSNIRKSDEEYNDHDYADYGDSQHSLLEASIMDEKEVVLEEDMEDDIQEYVQEEDTAQDIEEDIEVDTNITDMQEQVEESLAESEVMVVEELNDLNDAAENKSENSTDKKKKSEVDANVPQDLVLKNESGFTCLLCLEKGDKIVEDDKAIIAHMKIAHEIRLYICDLCGMDFRKRTELSTHLDDHVMKEEGDFQCEICNRIFSNLRLFRIHKRVHYPHLKSWACETCGKKYNSKNLLTEHMNTHTGARPYLCQICKKDFASKYTFRAHEKTHEVRPRPFECSQCNKTFLSQQNLIQHERTHTAAKEYVCTHCGKAFSSSHNLEVHSIVHSGYKPYVCKLCGKAFARKAEIRDHERTHTGEKPYQCELCGATFSQRSNLQSHKRATHYNDKRYKCEVCEKGFKRRRLLDYHIKAAHTGERPFKCDICSATFVYPEHFKKHRRIHTGEKPYLCEVCGKAFNSRDNRNAHRFIHSDKKPYECLVCGMGFMRKPLLYTHMQNQGHINDTIVVNQPRLTIEDDQVITIPDNNSEILMEETEQEQLDDDGLYVTELKNHVIIQHDVGEDQIYNGEESVVLNIPAEGTVKDADSLVIEGQMNFAETDGVECKTEIIDQVETVYAYNETVEGETVVVPTTQYQSGEKNVRLVQIRLPVEGESKNWLSLVQNT